MKSGDRIVIVVDDGSQLAPIISNKLKESGLNCEMVEPCQIKPPKPNFGPLPEEVLKQLSNQWKLDNGYPFVEKEKKRRFKKCLR